jgi:hypothetical protein
MMTLENERDREVALIWGLRRVWRITMSVADCAAPLPRLRAGAGVKRDHDLHKSCVSRSKGEILTTMLTTTTLGLPTGAPTSGRRAPSALRLRNRRDRGLGGPDDDARLAPV